MYLFKTSGGTYRGVIENQKHAYRGQPRHWAPGEIVLVSKNKSDLGTGEKQVQYLMRLEDIRELRPGEAERYWPGNEGRWNYIVECYDTTQLSEPFDLVEVIGQNAANYHPVVTFKRLDPADETTVMEFLNKSASFARMPIDQERGLVRRELQRLNQEFSDSPVERRATTSENIERNHRIVALLKRLHPTHCQICQAEHFVKKNGEPYSEIHHILPLAEGGGQATDNCLVLCPTCHRKMHYADVSVGIVKSSQLRISINGEPFVVERNLLSEGRGSH